MWQGKTTNFYIWQRNQIDSRDQLSSLLISNTKFSMDFILFPEENYVED